MTKKTNAKAKPVSKAARKAPGNAKALADKAADNVKRLNAQRGKAETVAIVKNTADGAHVYVEGSKGSHFTRSKRGDDKAFRNMIASGALYEPAERYNRENPAPKPQAQMARGTDAHTAPHSAKAVADQRKAATKAEKPSAPKAAKAKQPSRGADRDYTRGKTAIAAKPDSWRHHMLTIITKATNTAKAKAAHEKSGKFSANKLDFNWAAAQGYIVWSK